MNCGYPTKYSDRLGVEVTELHNDGAKLSVRLRGVLFSGRDFDRLEPEPDCAPELLRQFTFASGSLSACELVCRMPIPVVLGADTGSGELEIHLELGSQKPNGALDRELVSLMLDIRGQTFHSAGTSGWVEDELLSLQATLPIGMYLKACINCSHSDYSPYGHGSFGWMACFRNFKAEYANVRDKHDLFPILDKADLVQETYLCPDFEKRLPNTGYRR